jgi:hypothetical protein
MFGELLDELLQVPGAIYCCVADGAMGKVLASSGVADQDGANVHLAVLGWGATAEGYLAAAAHDELDDLIVTTRRAYHLVRELHGWSQPLLAYLQLDRRRANLAVARRSLATARPRGGAVPQPRQHREMPVQPAPVAVPSGPATRPTPAPPPVANGREASPHRRQVAALPSPRRPRPVPRAVPRAGQTPASGPLPRRTAEPPPSMAPRPRGADPPLVLRQRWADDVPTMKRLLSALQRLR